MASSSESSTSRIASVAFAVGFHPEIVPSSVAKMKKLGPEFAPLVTTKLSAMLAKTIPVGAATAPSGAFMGGGTVTTSGWLAGNVVPEPSYSVLTPVWLLETQKGL